MRADVLLFEGWFLGASPLASTALDPVLTPAELSYRPTVLASLKSYALLWRRFNQLWHLRAPSVSSTRVWKQQQESLMQKKTGVRLPERSFERFLRMIETCLPQEALQSIDQADFVVQLSNDRVIRELH